MNNPLHTLDTARYLVRGILSAIQKTERKGNTTALIKGAAAQNDTGYPTTVVTGTHKYSRDIRNYGGTENRTICLAHLLNLVGKDIPSALVFDNHALMGIFQQVDQAITGVFESPTLPDFTLRARIKELEEQLADVNEAGIYVTHVLGQVLQETETKDDLVEEQFDEIERLQEQVQVLTRALGDAQRQAAAQ